MLLLAELVETVLESGSKSVRAYVMLQDLRVSCSAVKIGTVIALQ